MDIRRITMTHTPLPWKIDKVTQYIGAPEIIADRRRIAKVLYHGGSEDREVDDNAAYIVQACNAYPALLEACKEARDMLGAIASGDPTQEILWTDLDAVLDKMNAAITAVEGHDA